MKYRPLRRIIAPLIMILLLIVSCATTTEVSTSDGPISIDYKVENLIGPKLKIAVTEFSNSTPYGQRRLGQNISSILITELSNTNRFIILEREQLDSVMDEARLSMSGLTGDQMEELELVGADYLIIGDVTKFAVSTEGQRSLASRSKVQKAEAAVDIRIINSRTGEIILSETGNGSAQKTTREVLGMGGSAGYDEGLEQDAFRASVASLMANIVNTLSEREWLCDVVDVDGSKVYINSGKKSNLKQGDEIRLYRQGEPLLDSDGRILAYREEFIGLAEVDSFLGEDAALLITNVDEAELTMPIIGKFSN